jgi:non-homologous end joining protein Ku
VDTKSGHFEPEKFEDEYEDALKELLKKKQAGEKSKPLRACSGESHQSDGCATPKRGSAKARGAANPSVQRRRNPARIYKGHLRLATVPAVRSVVVLMHLRRPAIRQSFF